MRDFSERRKVKRYKSALYSMPVIFFLFVLVVLLARQTWSMYVKSTDTRENLENAMHIYESAEARQADLSSDIENLKSDEGIEEEIRNTYGFVKEGEEMIIIVDDESFAEEEEDYGAEESLWARVKSWF